MIQRLNVKSSAEYHAHKAVGRSDLKRAWDEPELYFLESLLEPASKRLTRSIGDKEAIELEGTHSVSFGDWIIQGIKGELYPCKPDVFLASYEEMERMSHTPGHWEILWLSDDSCDIDGPNDELICTMPPIATLAKEHVANARLIAQAPCMLETIRNLTEWLETFATEDSVAALHEDIQKARDIINKATGARVANQ